MSDGGGPGSTAAPSPSVAAAKAKRPWHYRCHGFLGLHLSLFLGFVCLTGTLAVVSHEVEWLLIRSLRASSEGPPASWGARFDAARLAHPGVTLEGIGCLDADSGGDARFATVVSGRDRAGDHVAIHVDPASARVQGGSRGVTLHAFLRGLHYYLFDPTGWVFYLVALLGPLLIGLGVTGMLTYKRWWRGFVRLPVTRAKPRAWWGELHRLVAVWCLPFLFVIGGTGLWYLLEWDRILDWEPPGPELSAPLPPRERAWTGADIDRWASIAGEALPGMTITAIWLPWDARTPVQVHGQGTARLVRSRANLVAIDPATDAVILVRDAADMPARERWVHTADPLHFGRFGGLAGKLVWCLFGLGLTALCLSGAVIFAKRTARADAGQAW